MYEVVEKSNKVVFCRTNQNLNCMVSFRWKHQEFIQACVSINVLNKINLRSDFSATTICINCAPRHWSIHAKNSRGILSLIAYLSILTIHVIRSSSSSLSSPMNFIEVKRNFRFWFTRRCSRLHSHMQGFSNRTMRSPRNFSRMLRRLTAVSMNALWPMYQHL